MNEVWKAVGQWIVANVGWSVIIFLCILSGIFKITKREIDPLGWIIGWIGKGLTRDVRKDISEFKTETKKKFDEIKKDRSEKVDELKSDYNKQIIELRSDLDSFEDRTNTNIDELKVGTSLNCKTMKERLDQLEATTIKSNDLQTIRQIRAHVLDFANSCMNNRKHSKQDFENIIDENTQYQALVKKHKIENDVYAEDFKFIMNIYHENQRTNSFLNTSMGNDNP